MSRDKEVTKKANTTRVNASNSGQHLILATFLRPVNLFSKPSVTNFRFQYFGISEF